MLCNASIFQKLSIVYPKTALPSDFPIHENLRGLPTETAELLYTADFCDAVFSADLLPALLASSAPPVVFIRRRLNGDETIFYPGREPVVRSSTRPTKGWGLSQAEAEWFYCRLRLSAEQDGFPVLVSQYDMKTKICPWCGLRYRDAEVSGG